MILGNFAYTNKLKYSRTIAIIAAMFSPNIYTFGRWKLIMHAFCTFSLCIACVRQVWYISYFLYLQHVDYDNHYLCGYLKIQGLTDVSQCWWECVVYMHFTQDTFMTFFEGEIISKDHPFLTRKWVSMFCIVSIAYTYVPIVFLRKLMLELIRTTG